MHHAAPPLSLDRPAWRLVLRLAWPVLLQQALIFSVGAFDQGLAGRNPPEDKTLHVPYQAAQTTANYLAWFVASFAALVAIGSTALVARFVGRATRPGPRSSPTSRSCWPWPSGRC